MRQCRLEAYEKRVRKVGDERKAEVVEEIYHVHGIGEQVITSFIKLQVLGALGGQDVCYAPSITDVTPLVGNSQVLLWEVHQSICILVIADWRSRREESVTLMVTTSNHVLVEHR